MYQQIKRGRCSGSLSDLTWPGHQHSKLVPLAPSVEIDAGPGQRIPMEIPGYGGSRLLVLKYSNMSTRTVDCNPLLHIKLF